MKNMNNKVGEYENYAGTGPTMMPHFRQRHSVFIRYSRKDIILGILLAMGFLALFFWVLGSVFYYQPTPITDIGWIF